MGLVSNQSNPPRIVFGGDRALAVRVLKFLLNSGCTPSSLLLPGPEAASHSAQLSELFSQAGGQRIFCGSEVLSRSGFDAIGEARPDYIILIHLPLKIPPAFLSLPVHGILNLHPAYLPYNRGWHTPSWAILDGSPYGATLHFMSEAIDEGDIVHQRKLAVTPADTAHTLYKKVLELEFEVFREAWPALVARHYSRTPQQPRDGTVHKKRDLFAKDLQRLDLDSSYQAGALLDRMRALTTNRVDEACFFERNGTRYRVQVSITEEPVRP